MYRVVNFTATDLKATRQTAHYLLLSFQTAATDAVVNHEV